jgi:arginine decarboxylase
MKIYLTTGTGEGPTPLAAFDAALIDAGVANYNLICLSSVIPTGSEIERVKFVTPPDEYGYRLYIVMARQQEQRPGHSAWAGLGWTQDEASRRGLFVELHGPDRASVEQDIQATLKSMVASRSLPYGPIQSELVGITCRDRPVCAVVIAVYKSVSWEG